MPFARALPCILTALWLGAESGSAQAPPPGAQVTFKVDSDAEGLPQRTIFAMTPDAQGRLWAGTLAGVCFFDGYRWRTPELPASPHAVFVNANAMTALSDGRMWIGTRFQGILEARKETGWRLDRVAGLPSENVNAILESRAKDHTGKPMLWIATYDRGAARFADGAWRTFGPADGLDELRLFCLLERSGKGEATSLWAGSDRGLWIFDGQGWKPFEGNGKLPDRRVRTLAETVEGDGEPCLWIGFEQGGLARWKRGQLERMPVEKLTGCGHVRALLPDPSSGGKALLVGILGGGVARYEEGHWEVLSAGQGLCTNYVRSLAITPGGRNGGILWIGTEGRGVARYPGESWKKVQPPWPSPDPRVQCFFEAAAAGSGAAKLWMGNMSQGLAGFEGARWTLLGKPAGVPSETVRGLYGFPGRRDFYFGTFQGLGHVQDGHCRLFTPKDGLPAAQLRSLEGDPAAPGGPLLWIGTSRGLSSFDGHVFHAQPPPPGNEECSIRTLRLEESRLWVGTDRGLACLEQGRWVTPAFFARLGSASIRSILPQRVAGKRALWIGTYGSGIYWLPDLDRPEDLRQVTSPSEPELPRLLIHSMVQGPDGCVFASTKNGVLRLRLEGDRVAVDRFTTADGLPANECLEGGLYADRSGRIWVGTLDGVAYLEASKVGWDRSPKTLLWDSVQAKGRDLRPGAVLGHRDQGLDFQFRLVSHHREQDTRYQTQLEGLQSGPEAWTPSPSIHFYSLPPGRYCLKVWAKDYAGNVSGPIAFPFRMAPPPWLGIWAILGYGILAGGTVVGLMRLRTRILAERNRVLEASVQRATLEVHHQKRDLERLNQELLRLNEEKNRFIGIAAHDLKTPLNAIVLVCDGLLEGGLADCPKEIEPWLKRVDHAAKEMTSLIHEFLDINAIESGRMNPEMRAVSVQEALTSLLLSSQAKAEAKGQRIEVVSEPHLQVWADPQHLLQVLGNLLSNAIKFSPRDATLRLEAHGTDRCIQFSVEDQGPGLTEEDQANLFQRFTRLSARPTGGESSTGLGLSIALQLITAMGGRIWAENGPIRGAIFRIELAKTPGAPS
jgi:signal transduction histidine kinase/ligand-binding sensor domain-containing protein